MSVTLNINLLGLLSVGFDYLVEDALTCLADYGYPFTSLSGYHNQSNQFYCTPCPFTYPTIWAQSFWNHWILWTLSARAVSLGKINDMLFSGPSMQFSAYNLFSPYTQRMLNSFRNCDTMVIQRSVFHVMQGTRDSG